MVSAAMQSADVRSTAGTANHRVRCLPAQAPRRFHTNSAMTAITAAKISAARTITRRFIIFFMVSSY